MADPSESRSDPITVSWHLEEPVLMGDGAWVTMHVWTGEEDEEAAHEAKAGIRLAVRTVLRCEAAEGQDLDKQEAVRAALPWLAEKASDELGRLSLALGLGALTVSASDFVSVEMAEEGARDGEDDS